eukprot:gnl/MRDRNA2_/MRDRNA2_82405_c0_seq1.p1 gnl/MRDRNA2_/MRDRNA2_82405_c0~~gnl/MRDRNA2_/MRDRNA2_82405_c0_seq1.p1  ORF type:complete len:107 (-),score=16.74 gnl/MRDRNA2_/MRDRNA2_82405_c0_seq1:362-682(-)
MSTFQKNNKIPRDVAAKRDRVESTSLSKISTLELPASRTQMERVHRYLKYAIEEEHEAGSQYGGGDYVKAQLTNTSRLPANPLAQTSSLGRMIGRCKMVMQRRNRF